MYTVYTCVYIYIRICQTHIYIYPCNPLFWNPMGFLQAHHPATREATASTILVSLLYGQCVIHRSRWKVAVVAAIGSDSGCESCADRSMVRWCEKLELDISSSLRCWKCWKWASVRWVLPQKKPLFNGLGDSLGGGWQLLSITWDSPKMTLILGIFPRSIWKLGTWCSKPLNLKPQLSQDVRMFHPGSSSPNDWMMKENVLRTPLE